MATRQQDLFPLSPAGPLPEGFLYCLGALKPDDETRLLTEIANLPFRNFQFHDFEGKRRVVSFGWRYDFKQHKLLEADPIPQYLREVGAGLRAATGFDFRGLQQVVITEYAPGAPIGWHKDRPVFGEIMGLSLAAPCSFRFRKPLGEGKWKRMTLRMEPRSAYFLAGPARWEWEHSVAPVEALRYSLTFRNLRRHDE